jgi:hypothetical protein
VNEAALCIALLLRVPYGPVEAAYAMAGLDGVAVITCESQWNEKALRREPRGHTSWSYWQIDDEWHEQHRGDTLLHLATGAAIWQACMSKTMNNFTLAVRLYNSGSRTKGLAWSETVREKRDMLAIYLWRRLR